MTGVELATKEVSTKWVANLPHVISSINGRTKKSRKKKDLDPEIVYNGAKDMLEQGTKARYALDKPIDVVDGKRLHGAFRESDIRWSVEPKKITQVIVVPNMPVLYILNDDVTVAYTRKQLQPVEKESMPTIENFPQDYFKMEKVESISNRRKINNTIVFTVKWEGEKQTDIINRSDLMKYVPDMVRDYESKHINNKKNKKNKNYLKTSCIKMSQREIKFGSIEFETSLSFSISVSFSSLSFSSLSFSSSLSLSSSSLSLSSLSLLST
jgi:hypothetical protein